MGWRTHLTLGRVSNLPTIWTNVLAGMVLAGATPSLSAFLVLLLSLSLFYVGGMYLNDAFDREVDARERPDRPIPAGLISARRVFGLGFAMIAGGILLLVPGSQPDTRVEALLAGGVLAAVIIAYDVWHKGNPFSPVLMGLARALVYLTAGIASVGRIDSDLLEGALLLLAYLIGLTYVAKQETLGRVRNLWPLVFLAVPFVYVSFTIPGSATEIAIVLGFAAWVAYALSLLVREPRRIPRAVVSLIAGISLLDATLIATQGTPALAWAAVAGFAATLALQRVVSGT